jgi:hypothetical protein
LRKWDKDEAKIQYTYYLSQRDFCLIGSRVLGGGVKEASMAADILEGGNLVQGITITEQKNAKSEEHTQFWRC